MAASYDVASNMTARPYVAEGGGATTRPRDPPRRRVRLTDDAVGSGSSCGDPGGGPRAQLPPSTRAPQKQTAVSTPAILPPPIPQTLTVAAPSHFLPDV
jgi:hypothetical protein